MLDLVERCLLHLWKRDGNAGVLSTLGWLQVVHIDCIVDAPVQCVI